MKLSAIFAAGLPFAMTAFAAEKSGHAAAELITGVTSYQAGKTVPVGIKLKIDVGWHSYWVNPGVGGMPLSAKWTLPEGWTAGELQAPVPKRFMTGDLPGFGYEGEAIYRVDLTPPAGATGDAELKVALSWLTCSGDACVPGDVELSVKLDAGDGAAAKDAAVLAEADKKIPKAVKESTATVAEKDGQVVMTFTLPGDLDIDGILAFPATPEVVDAGAPIVLKKSEEGWTASAPKNEYADGPAKAYDLVLSGGKLAQPVIVQWIGK
ncbi:protein-disulfide reductase DsbD family protein [Luteolibacter flavescens]|uniref:Protein-disulfide reductase DsbD family protein n=1 Tax=Luteolibacter flavescens TaxID=1859460 RepID=A0ABT3FW56_9BACT|nr:protein-disulfide reductase DsbD domain-containing protein [Luteolibacter flavescens]MCW1887833.1 protein-disulfide reductase DsbD family protein [Luteolibacter flavescens]